MNKIFALLLCLFIGVSHAAKLSDLKAIGVNKTGNSATFGADLKAFPGVGNIKPHSESGWYQAGNYGVAPKATGPSMYMGADGEVIFAGTKYPFQAGYQVPKSSIVDAGIAIASAVNGPLGIGLAVAFPFLYDWATKSGLSFPSDGPITHTEPAPLSDYFPAGSLESCSAWRPNIGAGPCSVVPQPRGEANCFSSVTSTGGRLIISRNDNPGFAWAEVCPGSQLINTITLSSLSDIAPYLKSSQMSPDGRVIPEILSQGGDIPMPKPTVTGPAAIDGPETTTKNPDGTKTVEKTTYNFKTEGDTITNTTNNTTITTYNIDNSVKSTSTTTVTPAPSKTETPTDCEKAPDTIGCAKFGDAPDAEKLKNKEQDVKVTPVSFASSGSCPAPLSMTAFSQTYQISYQPLCDQMSIFRALFMVMSAFVAAWILANSFKV